MYLFALNISLSFALSHVIHSFSIQAHVPTVMPGLIGSPMGMPDTCRSNFLPPSGASINALSKLNYLGSISLLGSPSGCSAVRSTGGPESLSSAVLASKKREMEKVEQGNAIMMASYEPAEARERSRE